jgi:hypothetical protein
MSNLFVLPNLSSQNRLSAVRLMSGGAPAPAAATAETVNDIIANAANANNAVLAYVRGLSSTKLPFVPDSPAWYNKFVEQYSSLGANALYWQNSISPRLIETPRTIVSYGSLFDLKVSIMYQHIDRLILEPGNQAAREQLRNTLVGLIEDVGRQQKSVNTLGTDLAGYSTTLQNDAAIMADCVKQAIAEIGRDQQKIAELQKRIADLQSEAATWNKVLAGAGIGTAVSIFIGCIGAVLTVAFGPIGLLVLGLGVIGAVGGAATMIASMVKIRQIGDDIKSKSADLGRVQQRVMALQAVQTNVNNLITLSSTAQTEIGKLITAWDLLKAGMQSVVNDLDSSSNRLKTSHFVEMKSDLGKAEADWKDLSDLAKKFASITIHVEENVALINQQKAA